MITRYGDRDMTDTIAGPGGTGTIVRGLVSHPSCEAGGDSPWVGIVASGNFGSDWTTARFSRGWVA